MFIALIDIQIVSASLRDIGGGLSAGDDETVWVQTSYLIAEIIIIPLSGWLARVMSTRWLFAASAAGFTLMSLLCGWAWNIQSMIAFRALQGLAGGSMIPLVFTTAFAFFQGKQRVIAAATIGGLASLAPRWARRWAAGSPKTSTGTGCSLSTLFRGFTSRWPCRCW
jgi:DHA2 family multidrug resistance protein